MFSTVTFPSQETDDFSTQIKSCIMWLVFDLSYPFPCVYSLVAPIGRVLREDTFLRVKING